MGVAAGPSVVQAGARRPCRPAPRRCRSGCGRPGRCGSRRTAASRSTSGSQRGTVTATVPPGRSTRTSSAIAWMSAGMCSRISAATIRSNSPSANGSDERVALLDVGLGARGHLAGLLHRAEHVAHGGELVGVLVEGDHVGAAAVHLEGVPAGAAAQVEHPLPRPEPEAVEVNGQHVLVSLAGRRVGDRRPRTPRRWPRRPPAS